MLLLDKQCMQHDTCSRLQWTRDGWTPFPRSDSSSNKQSYLRTKSIKIACFIWVAIWAECYRVLGAPPPNPSSSSLSPVLQESDVMAVAKKQASSLAGIAPFCLLPHWVHSVNCSTENAWSLEVSCLGNYSSQDTQGRRDRRSKIRWRDDLHWAASCCNYTALPKDSLS